MADDRQGQMEAVILELLAERGEGKTICPSEAARRVAELGGEPEQWRIWMGMARAAAASMANRGLLVVLQRGERVDPADARGAIRLGLP
jgi:hypothetical protein